MVDRSPAGVDLTIVVAAAIVLAGCSLFTKVRPKSASGFRVEVTASPDGFEWATAEDQRLCGRAGAYPAQVASVLQEALSDDCPPCRGSRLSFRLFLLNDPVARRAEVVSLVLLSPPPEESKLTLEALSDVLSQTKLPSIPSQRPRCTLEVSVAPAGPA